MSFDGAKIHFFPDIPAVSAEILALRGWEGEKKRAASDCRGFRGRPPWAHYLTGGLSPCEQVNSDIILRRPPERGSRAPESRCPSASRPFASRDGDRRCCCWAMPTSRNRISQRRGASLHRLLQSQVELVALLVQRRNVLRYQALAGQRVGRVQRIVARAELRQLCSQARRRGEMLNP